MGSLPNDNLPVYFRLLSQLELEMQTWLLKMAAEFSHRKDQLVFLINNYDMIISVVAVSMTSSQLYSL